MYGTIAAYARGRLQVVSLVGGRSFCTKIKRVPHRTRGEYGGEREVGYCKTVLLKCRPVKAFNIL
jgi:hypothetical protein